MTEAKLQGVFPFWLTVDRNAASYLPAVFGALQYALLTKPELLPIVLLDWMKRLVKAQPFAALCLGVARSCSRASCIAHGSRPLIVDSIRSRPY